MTDWLTAFTDAVSRFFGVAQQTLFEAVVQPALYAMGLANHLEVAFDGTMWLLIGLLQILVLLIVFGPLQRWRPAEPVGDTADERAAVRVDVLYTLVHRLGLFRVALFFSVDPLFDWAFGQLRLLGVDGWQLDQTWPGVTDGAWISFLVYLAVFDFVDYALHRGQHRWRWWWQLHALHHSQRHMTMWTDNRNHLLDDVIRSSVLVLVAQAIGVGPGQFVAIVALTQLVESFSHANVRLAFGSLGERLLVSPRFHRVHHSIGLGHESSGPGSLGGRNFAVLFPVWDIVFRTADFGARLDPTGIRDQLPGEGLREPGARLAPDGGRDYGGGFWTQQWLGLLRLGGRA